MVEPWLVSAKAFSLASHLTRSKQLCASVSVVLNKSALVRQSRSSIKSNYSILPIDSLLRPIITRAMSASSSVGNGQAKKKPEEYPLLSADQTRLLQAMLDIPTISKVQIHGTFDGDVSSSDPLAVTTTFSQRNIPGNAQRRFNVTTVLTDLRPPSSPPTSLSVTFSRTLIRSASQALDFSMDTNSLSPKDKEEEAVMVVEDVSEAVVAAFVTLPQEVAPDVLLSVSSPTDDCQLLFVKAPPDASGASVALQFWRESRLDWEVVVPKTLHGAVVNDGYFASGAAWSTDGRLVAYVAETPADEQTPLWGGGEAVKDNAGPRTWRGQGKAHEDWGELNSGKRDPSVFLLDLSTRVISSLASSESRSALSVLPANATYGLPAFCPVTQGLVVVGWPHSTSDSSLSKGKKLGAIYCYNRETRLYYIPIGVDGLRDAGGGPSFDSSSGPSQFSSSSPSSSSPPLSHVLLPTHALRLTSTEKTPFTPGNPIFSPSGRRLVFLSQEESVKSGMHGGTAALLQCAWPPPEVQAAAAKAAAMPVVNGGHPATEVEKEEGGDQRSATTMRGPIKTTDKLPNQPQEVNLDVKVVIPVVHGDRTDCYGGNRNVAGQRNRNLRFPGLNTYLLDPGCFLDEDTLVVSTQWRSQNALIAVDLTSAAEEESASVLPLTPLFHSKSFGPSHVHDSPLLSASPRSSPGLNSHASWTFEALARVSKSSAALGREKKDPSSVVLVATRAAPDSPPRVMATEIQISELRRALDPRNSISNDPMDPGSSESPRHLQVTWRIVPTTAAKTPAEIRAKAEAAATEKAAWGAEVQRVLSRMEAKVVNVPSTPFSAPPSELHPSLPPSPASPAPNPVFQSVVFLPPSPSSVSSSPSPSRPRPPPAVLMPHGGPHTAMTLGWFPAYAFLVGLGYAVICPNYRGSTGYGQQFTAALPGKVGSMDMIDCATAVKAAVAAGAVDPKRVSVVGGSHGGFLTGHLLGQLPTVFRCGVLRNPVCNLSLMVGISDIPDWCYVEAMGTEKSYNKNCAPSAEDLAVLFSKSPIRWVGQVQAPMLFLLGAKDRRVPPQDAWQYISELRSRSSSSPYSPTASAPSTAPTDSPRVVVFPEDSHPLSKPQTEFEQWANTAFWLNHHNVDKKL